LDARERYYWDLTGYLVLRKVLTDDEVKAANDAVDYLGDRVINGTDAESDFLREHSRPRIEDNTLVRTSNNYPFFLSLKKPHCEPYRRMISHPALLSRLRVMCGRGFRMDHGPQFIGGIQGTRGGSLHGAGEPHRPYVGYSHQAGESHVGGVTVTYQLGVSNDGDGGFACAPGSHKSKIPMPSGVRTQEDEMGAVVEPALEPGDLLFFMDGAQTHGTHPWSATYQRRSILIKYASRTATRQGASVTVCPPETYWDDEIVDDMTPEQRAVMFGPCSAPRRDDMYLDVDPSGAVALSSGAAPRDE
jgi:ectoine hydroxylase-related dioxygenase (phytanoyl-CoA dioxygenase family)